MDAIDRSLPAEIDAPELSERNKRWRKAMKAAPRRVYVDRERLAYHRLGVSKYAALNLPYTLEGLEAMKDEEAEEARAAYEALGIPCTVSR